MAWLKFFLPKSLYARTLVILAVPLLVAMLAILYVFINHHLDSMTHRLADDISGEVSSLTEVYQSHAMDKQQLIAFAREHYNTKLSFQHKYVQRKKSESTMRALGEWFLEESLNENLKVPFYVKLDRNTIYVDVLLNEEVMHFEMSRKRLQSKTTPVYLLWFIGLPLLMLFIAALFMKNQVRPLRRLARAADKFGKGLAVPSIKPEGATEVRQAAMAFNRMQERIIRQITQRTEMLAGVSHDLRTPLTRMELELAMLGDSPEIEGLKQDVKDMKHMVESYLAFARGDEAEKTVMTNIAELLESLVERYGTKVRWVSRSTFRRPLKVNAMKRCFQNLLDNADKYADDVQISMRPINDGYQVIIEDNGPGIPESNQQDVFRPFYRLDASRNLDKGGVGLGLSIAQDVVHQHGGTIQLGKSQLGGLKVVVQLPG